MGVVKYGLTPEAIENTKNYWLRTLNTEAATHGLLVARAKEAAAVCGTAPNTLVDQILVAGQRLDHAITSAFEYGATTEEVLATSGLHPLYIEDLSAL